MSNYHTSLTAQQLIKKLEKFHPDANLNFTLDEADIFMVIAEAPIDARDIQIDFEYY